MIKAAIGTTSRVVCAFGYHFTGKERDAESGLDYFGARYYGPARNRHFDRSCSRTCEQRSGETPAFRSCRCLFSLRNTAKNSISLAAIPSTPAQLKPLSSPESPNPRANQGKSPVPPVPPNQLCLTYATKIPGHSPSSSFRMNTLA
jgi:hypothetical protein